MNEQAWLGSDDPFQLLQTLPASVLSERELLLFALECWRLMNDFSVEGSDRLFAAMVRYADRDISRNDLDEAFIAEAIHDGAPFGEFDRREAELYLADAIEKGVDRSSLCRLLRDIFGNPFRPVAFNPAWRSESATALARAMYESRNFSPMPILADALEEAGCDHADILSHCRQPDGVHVRGCWVVDLVLGKS